MAVAYDANGKSNTTAAQQVKTWSHTCTGSDRLLLVTVVWNQPNVSTELVSAVTYNGVAMTSFGSPAPVKSSATPGSNRLIQLFYLINPPTGANTVSVTMTDFIDFNCASDSFTGTDQTTPLDGYQSASSASGTSAALTITSATDNMVYAACMARTTSNPITVPNTSRWTQFTASNNSAGGCTAAGAASVGATFSWTTASHYAALGVNIRASATGSPVSKTQTSTARIALNITKTQGSIARIAKNLTKTQGSLARIAQNLTKTQTGTARIGFTYTKTQGATSRIAINKTKTQTGTARVARVVTKTQGATARVLRILQLTKTQTAIARIAVNIFEPPTADLVPPTYVDGRDKYMPRTRAAHGLFRHFKNRAQGMTVLKDHGGNYSVVTYPTQNDIDNAAVAYVGGHIYRVTGTEAAALIAAGFTVQSGVTA